MTGPRTEGRPDSPLVDSQTAEIRAEADKLLASPALAGSPRRAQLLRYLLDRALSGQASEISEYGIGLDVFGKPPSFDPRIDSSIRSEISRLRQKLREYAAAEGRQSRVAIELPSRSYVLEFTFRTPEAPPKRPPARAVLAAIGILALLGGGFAVWKARTGARTGIDSLVVLPFANMSADPRTNTWPTG